MQFGVDKPVSPMFQLVTVEDWVAIYHQIVYLEDCDKFVVDKVVKINVETGKEED